MTAGPLGALPLATLVTPVSGPATHLLSAKVCSQCSVEEHWPRQGKTSQKPVRPLQTVPLVQMAMQPPEAREAAAAPMAAAVMTPAPAMVLALPVEQAARARRLTRRRVMTFSSCGRRGQFGERRGVG